MLICPPGLSPATTPNTATPSVRPTWRLVVATAEATPACADGIPDTAVLAIGGLTSAEPRPNTAEAPRRGGSGVWGARAVSLRALAITARAPPRQAGREPEPPLTGP